MRSRALENGNDGLTNLSIRNPRARAKQARAERQSKKLAQGHSFDRISAVLPDRTVGEY